VQTGQIFQMAILQDHDNNYKGNDDDNDEEGSARETRRFQSGEFQERDRDIRAEEQTLLAFHFVVFQCFKNAQLFTLWCFNALKMLNFSLFGVSML